MSDTLDFKTFCFEAYKNENSLSGRETMELFKKYGVLQYLDKHFDILHTQGRLYLVKEIEMFIKARRVGEG